MGALHKRRPINLRAGARARAHRHLDAFDSSHVRRPLVACIRAVHACSLERRDYASVVSLYTRYEEEGRRAGAR